MPKRDGFTSCRTCWKLIQDERFEEHLVSHEQEDREKLNESLLNPYNSSSNFFESNAPNLDATKDMGYLAREERGKYGSRSGHDGFDDESES
jgi:hypothetical protein